MNPEKYSSTDDFKDETHIGDPMNSAAGGRWLPDPPFAAAGMWMLLLLLIGSDIALLKPMVAAATDEPSGWLTWLLTIGIGVALAAVAYLAAEFWMRGGNGRRCVASVFLLIWLATVALSFFFRLRFHSPTEAGLNDGSIALAPGAPSAPNSLSATELLLAGLLTALLLLTGVIAAALTALSHDDLQKQRRIRARRLTMLRLRLSRVINAENRHRTAASDRQAELDDLVRRTAEQREKLPGIAESIAQEIRLRMATALGDPASTSALTGNNPSLADRPRR
ncbi:hypothetical protein [Nocardia brasiliensis]|uniref:hypothetical protein n=1 Tax=Nocardia brasiliensis TaxID=37326 RepID=UPI0024543DC3|nr:hypothetical protein [Nocardia brasiliensis]